VQSFNEIGDDGAQSIAAALQENSSLQDLSLVRSTLEFLLLLDYRLFCPAVHQG
jgi:hypothetical protein